LNEERTHHNGEGREIRKEREVSSKKCDGRKMRRGRDFHADRRVKVSLTLSKNFCGKRQGFETTPRRTAREQMRKGAVGEKVNDAIGVIDEKVVLFVSRKREGQRFKIGHKEAIN